jgi:hypothetical protein
MGLSHIAQISGDHGWEPLGDGRKVVRAQVDYTGEEPHGPRPALRRAS